MKRLMILFIVISFLLLHESYAEVLDLSQDLHRKYTQSYNQWQYVKGLWRNSYQYTFSESSWVGFRRTTTMFIVNGEVVGREYTTFFHGQQRDHWFENKDQLSSHGTRDGAIEPKTLDTVYSACLQSLSVSTANDYGGHSLIFDVDTANYGLLKTCGNIPRNCADDCFFGVSIYDLKPYQLQQQQQQQPGSSTVLMTSTTINQIDRKSQDTIRNNGNATISWKFLLFLNIFVLKTIINFYAY